MHHFLMNQSQAQFDPWEMKNRKPRSNEALDSRKFKKDYNVSNSNATKVLKSFLGYPPGIKELVDFGKQITKLKPNLKPSSHCRRIPELTKWVEDNLDDIQPLLNSIDLKQIRVSPKIREKAKKTKKKLHNELNNKEDEVLPIQIPSSPPMFFPTLSEIESERYTETTYDQDNYTF